jgi:hypothetical protein
MFYSMGHSGLSYFAFDDDAQTILALIKFPLSSLLDFPLFSLEFSRYDSLTGNGMFVVKGEVIPGWIRLVKSRRQVSQGKTPFKIWS